MKKQILVVLAVVVFITCSVSMTLADTDAFQLRNGILFGDSLETIKQKETFTIEEDSKDATNKVWFDGTIGGMKGCVRFDFDETTGGLKDMLYSFDTASSKDSVDSDYTKLRESLIRKYGSPLGNTGGTLNIITGTAIDYCALIINLYKLISGDGDLRDYDEWIVICDGFNVKIDLVSYYYRNKDYEYSYQNLISYHYYTDEDFNNAVNEKQEQNDALDNDL